MADDPQVAQATERARAAQARVLLAARREGRLRDDASDEDLRLLFAAPGPPGASSPGAGRGCCS